MTEMRYFERTGAIVVVILMFMLSTRMDFEFWLAGNRHTNFLTSAHIACAIALSLNIAKYLAFTKLAEHQNRKIRAPWFYLVTLVLLIGHSIFTNYFVVAKNFDRPMVAETRAKRLQDLQQDFDFKLKSLDKEEGLQATALLEAFNENERHVQQRFKDDFERTKTEIARQRTITDRLGDYMFSGYSKAIDENETVTRKRDAELEPIKNAYNQSKAALTARFVDARKKLDEDFLYKRSELTEEKLLAQNSMAIADPMFQAGAHVLMDLKVLQLTPSLLIFFAALFITLLLEFAAYFAVKVLEQKFELSEPPLGVAG